MESISCIEAGGIRAARLGEVVEEGIAYAHAHMLPHLHVQGI